MVTRRNALVAGATLLALLVLALAAVWFQREPIATQIIDDYLAEKGVIARYDVAEIGTRKQRFENLSIGDPDDPDLTAKWVEVDVSPRFSGVAIKAVRASGVRLKATFADNKLSFGVVDKLLPPPSKEPFTWPDMDLKLQDARAKLNTPWGQFGARLDGAGNPAGTFDGKVALVSRSIAQDDCTAKDMALLGTIGLKNGNTHVQGPLTLGSVACKGSTMQTADLALDMRTDPKFNDWSGRIALAAIAATSAGARLTQPQASLDFTYLKTPGRWTGGGTVAASSVQSGANGGRGLKGDFSLAGSMETGAKGKASAALASLFVPQMRSGPATVAGDFELAQGNITSKGALTLKNAIPDARLMSALRGLSGQGKGTPFEPLADALLRDFARLGSGGDAKADYAFVQSGKGGRVTLSNVEAKSRSGARLAMAGASPLTYGLPGGLTLSGKTTLSGGGLPATTINWKPLRGGFAGVASIAPYAAGKARLATTPISFSYGSSGLSLATTATVDGPLGTAGRIDGLVVPIALRNGGLSTQGCVPVRYQRVRLASLDLSSGQLSTCLTATGASLSAPKIAGRIGGSPLAIAASRARFTYARGDFAVDGLSVRLGTIEKMTQLDASSITGTMRSGAALGRFSGASGTLANVPLLLSGGAGNWGYAKDVLTVNGGLGVADAEADPRFQPLISNDFTLRMANGQIIARASANEAITGAHVTTVDIVHDLGAGMGSADLDVPGINFGPTLQPEQLTRLTLGMIANVQGRVYGKGHIDWSDAGVTSMGRFGTDNLDLAAAFGPVTGLKGEISLSDLLQMETPPSQVMSIGTINPGILINRGDVRYQLLPGKKIGIEGGRWPVSGGYLILEPTILDLGETAERRLTFRVEGLDAATFIQQMEFSNISATGTFNGVLPMIFDANGGRIEGGWIEAASGGGTLSYVGELSRENLGDYGSMAFDALKSMQYKSLRIELAGPLDGEMVTLIKFAGINRSPVTPSKVKLPIKVIGLSGIDFIFNISITAPFRRMIWMARSFEDPSSIIGDEIARERRRLLQEKENASSAAIAPPVQAPAIGDAP